MAAGEFFVVIEEGIVDVGGGVAEAFDEERVGLFEGETLEVGESEGVVGWGIRIDLELLVLALIPRPPLPWGEGGGLDDAGAVAEVAGELVKEGGEIWVGELEPDIVVVGDGEAAGVGGGEADRGGAFG